MRPHRLPRRAAPPRGAPTVPRGPLTSVLHMPLVEIDRAAAQRRARRTLVATQVLGGLGVGTGVAVATLLAYDLAGTAALAGLAGSATALGSGLAAAAIGASAHRGRRPGLTAGYLVGATGALGAVVAARLDSLPLLLLAGLAFGGAGGANLQARYAATDLALPERRAADLALVVWATTVGAVLGPNLTGPGAALADLVGVPRLAGPYLLSGAAFALAGLAVATLLRPDPLLLARRLAGDVDVGAGRVGVRRALGEGLAAVRVIPAARAAAVTIAAAHATMVGVMSMTPVHMGAHGADVQLVGLTISLHIAGMYALSPLVGRLTDRLGPRTALWLGFVQLAGAVTLAASGEPHGGAGFLTGLVLLGTGWSFCLIGSSALLTATLPLAARAPAQGLTDLTMNAAGATAGGLSGVLVTLLGFPTFATATLALLVVPVALVRRGAVGPGAPPAPAAPAVAAV
jgi:MFS family permease